MKKLVTKLILVYTRIKTLDKISVLNQTNTVFILGDFIK